MIKAFGLHGVELTAMNGYISANIYSIEKCVLTFSGGVAGYVHDIFNRSALLPPGAGVSRLVLSTMQAARIDSCVQNYFRPNFQTWKLSQWHDACTVTQTKNVNESPIESRSRGIDWWFQISSAPPPSDRFPLHIRNVWKLANRQIKRRKTSTELH